MAFVDKIKKNLKPCIIVLVTVVIVVIVAYILGVHFGIFKKESFKIGKGVTIDLSMDSLIADAKKDLNAIGIKFKK